MEGSSRYQLTTDSAGFEERRKSVVVGQEAGLEHAAVESQSELQASCMGGEASDDGVVKGPGRGVEGAEEGVGVVEVAGGGDCAKVEELGVDEVGVEGGGLDDDGVELFELGHGFAGFESVEEEGGVMVINVGERRR